MVIKIRDNVKGMINKVMPNKDKVKEVTKICPFNKYFCEKECALYLKTDNFEGCSIKAIAMKRG